MSVPETTDAGSLCTGPDCVGAGGVGACKSGADAGESPASNVCNAPVEAVDGTWLRGSAFGTWLRGSAFGVCCNTEGDGRSCGGGALVTCELGGSGGLGLCLTGLTSWYSTVVTPGLLVAGLLEVGYRGPACTVLVPLADWDAAGTGRGKGSSGRTNGGTAEIGSTDVDGCRATEVTAGDGGPGLGAECSFSSTTAQGGLTVSED